MCQYIHCFPWCAGKGEFRLYKECWSCSGADLDEAHGRFGSNGTTNSATAGVLVPGGGLYRLRYRLKNGAGPPNSWQARIDSIDNAFSAIELESFADSVFFDWTERELPFSLPEGTAVIRLTFEARQVCEGDHLHNPAPVFITLSLPVLYDIPP